MGSKRNVDMSANQDTVKVIEAEKPELTSASDETTPAAKAVPVAKRTRSKKYQSARSHVDKTKSYDPFAAIELIKKTSYSKFDGTITADLIIKDEATQIDVSFPHSTGKALRVAVVDDTVIKQIEEGNLDFDILITTPQFVPKLAKHARVLGPRGLMPNPKNGTITSDPEKKKKELESGKVTLKSERKFPLMHVSIGSVSMETKQLVENFSALIDALGTKVKRASLSASMSPSVKVTLS